MSNRKKRNTVQQTARKENAAPTLSDSLDDDVLAKLKAAKTTLTKVAEENEEKRQKQLKLEREEREKNKSFEELLNEHEGFNSKR
ncbi:YqkE family protein [Sporosarcina sp. G11-34]|uniref:YqkE family protein n=1 Tax=Sporosarcina sp. G11-34 TaxID=2849605 RepID=UPI0022A8F234|nr:YqkE family protein [Sporosarcina sp. G11-34]